MSDAGADRVFSWREAVPVFSDWLERAIDPRPGRGARTWKARLATGGGTSLALPVVALPDEPDPRDPRAFASALRDSLGLELVLLVQAGAFAAGLYLENELVAHRVRRRYVVRGRGRAQPTYLDRKGKSRYGSRLRLRNARRLIDDLRACLAAWSGDHGAPDRVYLSCPVRLRAEISAARPPVPLDPRRTLAVPFAVRRPAFEELGRIRWLLCHGRVVVTPAGGCGTAAEGFTNDPG